MVKRELDPTMQRDRWTYLWLALAALFFTFSSGRWTLPIAAWLAPVFIIRFMRTQPLRRGLLLTWAVTYVVATITWWGLDPQPPIVHLILIAFGAALQLLPLLADRLLAPQLPGLISTLVYPAAYTALDYLYVAANPTPSVNAHAYTLYGNLALLQLASVTGMWGLTFLASWFATVVNWAWERSFAWRETWRGAAIYGGILLAVLVYGEARLAFSQPQPGTVRATALTSVDLRAKLAEVMASARENRSLFRQTSAEHQDRYFRDTVREAQAGARLVLWPEMAIPVAKEDEGALIARGQAVASEQGIYLAMLYYTSYAEEGRGENKLVLVDPSGDVVLEHLKFGGAAMEGWQPGDGVLRTVESPYGTLSGVICADTNFPLPMRQAGRNGTDILFSPTLEWQAINPQSVAMAVFRAIENGVSILRAADNGRSLAIDPYGRILAAADHFRADEWAIVAQLPTHGVFTLYSVIGDVVPWSCAAGVVLLTVWGVLRKRGAASAQRQGGPESPPGA
jgi:apolipoprotein N-acyltransferase